MTTSHSANKPLQFILLDVFHHLIYPGQRWVNFIGRYALMLELSSWSLQ
jgi:hypothetical protein